jgi:hypothetical protein
MIGLGAKVGARDLELHGNKKLERGVIRTTVGTSHDATPKYNYAICYEATDLFWILPIVIEYLEHLKATGKYCGENVGYLSGRNHDHPNIPQLLMDKYNKAAAAERHD